MACSIRVPAVGCRNLAHLPDFEHLRGRDVSELIYALIVGLLIIPLVAFGWLRGAPPARAISADLFVLLLAIGACGVGVDLVHRMLLATFMDGLAGVLEDGGEMLMLSVTCAYVVQWTVAVVPPGSQVRFRPAKQFGL